MLAEGAANANRIEQLRGPRKTDQDEHPKTASNENGPETPKNTALNAHLSKNIHASRCESVLYTLTPFPTQSGGIGFSNLRPENIALRVRASEMCILPCAEVADDTLRRTDTMNK